MSDVRSWEDDNSVTGNRWLRSEVTLEHVGAVRVVTCRAWGGEAGSRRQSAHYSTTLLWDESIVAPTMGVDGIVEDYTSVVVHHYRDEREAEVGHVLWSDATTVGSVLVNVKRGAWTPVGRQYAERAA